MYVKLRNLSNTRALKVKCGSRLAIIAKDFKETNPSSDTEKSTARIQYDNLSDILKSDNHTNISQALKEYSLKRSFSEKLERKKQKYLDSFFAVRNR